MLLSPNGRCCGFGECSAVLQKGVAPWLQASVCFRPTSCAVRLQSLFRASLVTVAVNCANNWVNLKWELRLEVYVNWISSTQNWYCPQTTWWSLLGMREMRVLNVSWWMIGAYYPSWKHSHSAVVPYTLLEMLDVFSMFAVVGKSVAQDKRINPPPPTVRGCHFMVCKLYITKLRSWNLVTVKQVMYDIANHHGLTVCFLWLTHCDRVFKSNSRMVVCVRFFLRFCSPV
jgi:hypothetical protein